MFNLLYAESRIIENEIMKFSLKNGPPGFGKCEACKLL